MESIIRKHVEMELKDFRGNRELMKRLGQQIRECHPAPTRDYAALLHRIVAIKCGICACGYEGKLLYHYRYNDGLSWVAVAMKMHVSEVTVKRYHAKLLQSVAKHLGWI